MLGQIHLAHPPVPSIRTMVYLDRTTLVPETLIGATATPIRHCDASSMNGRPTPAEFLSVIC